MSSPQPSDTTDTDGESRNREAVRTLLKLHGESLMTAVAKGSKATGIRLDYGNTSAWMREIPGRFGQSKQRELLRYLGIEDHRLDPRRIHFWILPNPGDTELSGALFELLTTYADQPSQFLWLSNSAGAFRGLAILAGGVSIVFLPTAGTNRLEMEQWLENLKDTNIQGISAEAGVKSDAIWQELISNKLPPEVLWSASEPTTEQDWHVVIDLAEKNGLDPQSAQKLLSAALLLLQEGESATELLEQVIAKKITRAESEGISLQINTRPIGM